MTLNELKVMYEKALEDHVVAMKEMDDFDLNHMEEPWVMLAIENPTPKDGSTVTVFPGLDGKVSTSVFEINGDNKVVTSFVMVTCSDIEKFMSEKGLNIKAVKEMQKPLKFD